MIQVSRDRFSNIAARSHTESLVSILTRTILDTGRHTDTHRHRHRQTHPHTLAVSKAAPRQVFLYPSPDLPLSLTETSSLTVPLNNVGVGLTFVGQKLTSDKYVRCLLGLGM